MNIKILHQNQHTERIKNIPDFSLHTLESKRTYCWDPNIVFGKSGKVDISGYYPYKGIKFADLLILDGTDMLQVMWALIRTKANDSCTLLLSKGDGQELSEKYNCKFYEDRGNYFMEKFGIKELPAVIHHDKSKIYISVYA